MKIAMLIPGLFYLLPLVLHAQQLSTPADPVSLTIRDIMRDPLESIGSLPDNIHWSYNSETIYFDWDPQHTGEDSLYAVPAQGGTPRKVSEAEERRLPASDLLRNLAGTHAVYEKEGDIFLLDLKKGIITAITKTLQREHSPVWLQGPLAIAFRQGNNLFRWESRNGTLRQLTDFRDGTRPTEPAAATGSDGWLARQEQRLLTVVREEEQKRRKLEKRGKAEEKEHPRPIYLQGRSLQSVDINPDERFITFLLLNENKEAKSTEIPDYINAATYTTTVTARPRVGSPQDTYELGIYDTTADTVYYVDPLQIPGIYDRPNWQTADSSSGKTARNVVIYGPWWSDNGQRAMVVVRAWDNKDRWIMRLNPVSAALDLLDRQHDDAWIGGPGISGWVYDPGNVGWMPDDRRVWFQSEESGYSHLYTVDVLTGKKTALTAGTFEVEEASLSRDKKSWYLSTSEVGSGERHFYRMPLEGGKRLQITGAAGRNEVVLSPDEKTLAIRHSYTTSPWQLYTMPNKSGATARRITDNLSESFRSYKWKEPEMIRIRAADGEMVPARVYRPANPQQKGPAVIFVHGAGYLQNVHRWWGPYYREYMFHNFLVDKGYTVLDIDYRGSAGYGRDWRTGIYRFMGGLDLDDQIDGAKWLEEQCDVDPARIGIYGGSYGGFITFMAMFTEPGIFACGAALRPVSDWAHYNHPYTSNILNEPQQDSLAYVRSSPIYHAEGLQGALLICHGMIDTNVHFQDVVRLAQRLIELGKDNWELAVYPVEGHGFTKPSSWSDEYRRIFRLFEENLK